MKARPAQRLQLHTCASGARARSAHRVWSADVREWAFSCASAWRCCAALHFDCGLSCAQMVESDESGMGLYAALLERWSARSRAQLQHICAQLHAPEHPLLAKV